MEPVLGLYQNEQVLQIIGMTQEEQGNHSMMEQFQSAYAAMLAQLERVDNERRNIMMLRESEVGTISMELRQKTNYYEALLNDKDKRIGELEDMVRRLESDENEKNRKEMRRYMESNNEKEAENNALKRQINSLKTKINSLQSELSSCNNSKEDMELFIVKSFEQLKIANKEINNNIDQNETEAMVMDSKLKQTNQKTTMLTERITELEVQIKNSEESYGKMKTLFKNSKDQCLNLKFQLQELKERSRSHKHNNGQAAKENERECFLLNEIEGIIELKNVIRERESFLKQVSDYHDMNSSLLNENDQLKARIRDHENQLHEFKSKYVPGYQDELLKKADLPLFEYLEGKKANFMHFEQIIEKIESYIEEKDDHINKILTGFSERNLQCVCGKEAEVTRLHSQCSRLQSDLTRLQNESSKHSSDSTMIQAELSRYQSEASRLEGQLAKLQAQYSKYKSDVGKLKPKEAELTAAISKNEAQQETIQKLRKDVLGYEKVVSQYKAEMKEILTLDPRAKKKRTQKKRCLGCFFNIERNETTENCAECKRTYHSTCIDDHKCEIYKFDDGMSYISGANE